MKIGNDEIGLVGVIGLILIFLSVFMFGYLLLYGHPLWFVGVAVFVLALAMYYSDLYSHRRKKS